MALPMKEDTFKRLLSLIEKTGDRLIITDPAGEHPYVLMGLDHYEKLVVGEWKPEVQKRESAPPQTLPISTGFPDNKPPKREIPLWKPALPKPKVVETPTFKAPVPKPTPPPVTPPPAPIVPSIPPIPAPIPEITAPEPEGEEQFYLEPLE